MPNIITESGMNFVADNAFHIEKSLLYTNLGDGVRSVEFVRGKANNLLFIEAKTTFPSPDNPSTENFVKFQTQIDEICDKFIHSLNLFSSVKIGVAEDELSNDLILPEKISLVFILVIKNHEFKWCKPIREKLMTTLPLYLKKIWKPEIYVINKDVAAKYSLTVNP